MAFQSRPNLDDIQFRQIPDSVLTLSGDTKIGKIGGLKIIDDNGNYIPIILSGGTINDVLTLDNNQIILKQPTSGVGSYVGKSPSTCTVGGLTSGGTLTNCSFSNILERILVPSLNPNICNPTLSFNITPPNVLYEVGTTVSVTGTTNFNRGSVIPPYNGVEYRAGLPNTYKYIEWGSVKEVNSNSLNNTISFANKIISANNNTLSSSVCYDQGDIIYNNEGNVICDRLPSGTTCTITYNITGVYPYYFGKISSNNAPIGENRPTDNYNLIITGGTKCVGVSTGTISVNFNSIDDDYIWFAHPTNSPIKTKWFVDSINCGNIGGTVSPGGELFPTPVEVNNVSTPLWNNQTFKFYLSNYQTLSTAVMQLRNN